MGNSMEGIGFDNNNIKNNQHDIIAIINDGMPGRHTLKQTKTETSWNSINYRPEGFPPD